MKKLAFIPFVFCFAVQSSGQEKETEKIFTDLNNSFKTEKVKLDSLIKNFKDLNEGITLGNFDQNITELSTKKKEIRKLEIIVDSIKEKAETYKNFYVYECKNRITKETDTKRKDSLKTICEKLPKIIDGWMKEIKEYEKPELLTDDIQPKAEEAKVYMYFGKDKVINEDVIKEGTPQAEILKEVLSQKNETYFGDITIPKENQEFYFCNYEKTKCKSETYKFNKIAVEIKDGSFSDIKVYVEYNGNTHIFENLKGVSILRYSSFAKDNYLFYKQSIVGSKTFKLDEMEKFTVRLGDVMVYDYKIGNNYIPSNLTIELPQKDSEDKKTNENNPAQYKIRQETDLDKVVEFRTYSDFLALFGDSDNGLVQIEGKAKFYFFPFPMQIKNGMQCEVLNTVSPYVNYSRFDDDVRYVGLNETKDNISTKLDLVQKRYLTMGLEANLFRLKHKDFPVEVNLYGTINYQLSEVNFGNDSIPNTENIKTLGYGGGLHISSKRLNHFGFDYKFEFTWYDYHNFNHFETLYLPEKLLPVIRNEAEVFYKSGANSAIFARLITFNNSSSKNNEAFYQFQFGMKFSIGNRVVNKN